MEFKKYLKERNLNATLYNEDSLYIFNKPYLELSILEIAKLTEYLVEKKNPRWKKIELDDINLKHVYEISSLGIVRRKLSNGIYKYIFGSLNNDGYRMISLPCQDKVRNIAVHRLVAFAFIPNYYLERDCINHINGNKLNNRVENLEWVTREENNIHAIKNGLINPHHGHQKYGEESGTCTHTEEQVREACKLIIEGKLSITEISKKLNVTRSFIKSLFKGCWHRITEEYQIPQIDSISNQKIRNKIRKLVEENKSIDEIKKAFDPNLTDEWDKYILKWIEKLAEQN